MLITVGWSTISTVPSASVLVVVAVSAAFISLPTDEYKRQFRGILDAPDTPFCIAIRGASTGSIISNSVPPTTNVSGSPKNGISSGLFADSCIYI